MDGSRLGSRALCRLEFFSIAIPNQTVAAGDQPPQGHNQGEPETQLFLTSQDKGISGLFWAFHGLEGSGQLPAPPFPNRLGQKKGSTLAEMSGWPINSLRWGYDESSIAHGYPHSAYFCSFLFFGPCCLEGLLGSSPDRGCTARPSTCVQQCRILWITECLGNRRRSGLLV
jgi:hypothetical protein